MKEEKEKKFIEEIRREYLSGYDAMFLTIVNIKETIEEVIKKAEENKLKYFIVEEYGTVMGKHYHMLIKIDKEEKINKFIKDLELKRGNIEIKRIENNIKKLETYIHNIENVIEYMIKDIEY
jgi:hypothetical protein